MNKLSIWNSDNVLHFTNQRLHTCTCPNFMFICDNFVYYMYMYYWGLACLAQFHGSAYRRVLRLRSRFPAYVQAPSFCTSLVSVECLVGMAEAKVRRQPLKSLAVSTECPASVSADSVLAVSRAIKLGPDAVIKITIL